MVINVEKLDDELKYYCGELEDLERSSRTIQNYYISNKLFISYLKTYNIIELDNDNIDNIMKKYRSYLKTEQGNKPSTRKKYLKEIILFLETLDLKISIELPKDNHKNKKIKHLSMEEIQEVIETIPKSMIRDRAIIQILSRTGVRVSELSNLKKDDLNLKSTELAITLEITNGKGGKDRTVCIDQETVQLLNKMIYKRTRKGKKDKTEYLFTARTGSQLKVRDIERIVKKYAIRTDERLSKEERKTDYKNKLTPHTLRHSFAIHLLNEAGRPINEVQALLGHENIATTNIYAQVGDKTIKKGYKTIKWE